MAARKLETNVSLEFAKLNIKLISQFTKMTTNINIKARCAWKGRSTGCFLKVILLTE